MIMLGYQPVLVYHSLSESKVLGLSLTYYKCFLDIGTMTIESAPHPLEWVDSL